MELVYGPVSSWRLGRSLGIDPICRMKVCSFDCTYCSLGRTTEKTVDRRAFVPVGQVKSAAERALEEVEADFVTFSGTGEPTLAQNLGEAIDAIRRMTDLPIAVLTNSSLMERNDVRSDLARADHVVGSLDAPDDETFRKVNLPHRGIRLERMIEGMKKFRDEFEGKFSLEVMFVPDNRDLSEDIADIIRAIDPDEVQINTPLRSSPVRPLTPEELKEVQRDFEGLNYRSVYEAKKEEVEKVVGPGKLRRLKRIEGSGNS